MEFPKNGSLPAGERKVNEYVSRIQGGENKEDVLQGLPESFLSGVEQKLSKVDEWPETDEQPALAVEIPPQYQGLDADTLDFIWTIPEYVDVEMTNRLRSQKKSAVAFLRGREELKAVEQEQIQADQARIQELRQQLGVASEDGQRHVEAEFALEEMSAPLSLEERKKLRGWEASYELAKIAKRQGVDLAGISREEYVTFAIQNDLEIDDTQLWASPWQRMGTSVEEIVRKNREEQMKIGEDSEKEFARFCYETQQKAATDDRSVFEGIRVRQGTKDSNSWLFFGINDGVEDNGEETYKAYISVKDLNTLTPARFTQFMGALKDAQYDGDIKIFQDLSEQGVRLNDQVVMHGRSQRDAELALQVAENFFRDDLAQKSVGRDGVVDGKKQSYSQILAGKIREAIRSPSDGTT